MKKIVLSGIVALGLSGMVYGGGDIAPVAPMPADSWSGFYVGLQAGGNWGDADLDYYFNGSSSLSGYTRNLDPNGFAGGIYAGYNWLIDGNWLFGVEGDWNYLSGDDTGDWLNSSGNPVTPNWTQTIENEWDASLRLRIGKVIDDFMPYFTAGAAWARVTTRLDCDTCSPQHHYSGHATLSGWTIGAGVEYKISDNMNVRLQYRYSDYGDDSVRYHADDGSNSYADIKVHYKASMVQVGFSYRF